MADVVVYLLIPESGGGPEVDLQGCWREDDHDPPVFQRLDVSVQSPPLVGDDGYTVGGLESTWNTVLVQGMGVRFPIPKPAIWPSVARTFW